MGQNMGQIVRQQNFQRSPNLISICVDEIRNGELSGRLYHCYSEEACPFSNVAHLIELARIYLTRLSFRRHQHRCGHLQIRAGRRYSRLRRRNQQKSLRRSAAKRGRCCCTCSIVSGQPGGHGQMGRRRSRVEILQ